MSKGDIARLNKMYKCPPRTAVNMEISMNGQTLESEKAEKEKIIENALNSLNLNEIIQGSFENSKKSSPTLTQTNGLQELLGKFKNMKQSKSGSQVIRNKGSKDDGLDDFDDDLSDFESDDDFNDFEANDDLNDFESNDELSDFKSNDEISLNDNLDLNDPIEDELNDELQN